MNPKSSVSEPELPLEGRIHLIRSQRIVLDRDLAELYGVTTHRLNEQVRRNSQRFPDDFLLHLTNQEVEALATPYPMPSSNMAQ